MASWPAPGRWAYPSSTVMQGSPFLSDSCRPQKAVGAIPLYWRRELLGVLVGVDDAVRHGDGGEQGQNPQHRSHCAPVVEQGADDDEHNALRPLHETHLALADEGLGAGARVAD